jgi:hypothetical protein
MGPPKFTNRLGQVEAVAPFRHSDAELQRLMLLKKNHLDEQYVARRNVRDLPEKIASMSGRLSKLAIDQQTVSDHALGVYCGLRFGVVLHPQFPTSVFIEGAIARQSQLSRENQGPRAVLNALERLAAGYDQEANRTRQDLAIGESQLRDYQARLGKPFLHDQYLSELTALQLKAGLSATANETDSDRPSVFQLTDSIKALKATHTIEAPSPRVRQKQATAEEPVTTASSGGRTPSTALA